MTIRPSISLLITCMVALLQQQVSKRLQIFILLTILYALHKKLTEKKQLHKNRKYTLSKEPSLQRALKLAILPTLKRWQEGRMVYPFYGLNHYFESIILNPNMSFRDKMKYESKRLETFRLAPGRLLESAFKLAKDGLYYTGENNTYKCAFCDHYFEDTGQDLTDQHKILRPCCPFVSNRTLPSNIAISNELPIVESIHLEPLNLSQRLYLWKTKIKYPQYNRYNFRLLSFGTFPVSQLSHARDVQIFAEAGFFHTGPGDSVRCFDCGIGISQWLKNDDPYVEHARFSPNCNHLKEKIGQQYIDYIQKLVTQAEEECKKSSTDCCPRYKAYAVLAARVSSFKGWPSSSGPTSETMAKAGFFYTGVEDCARCFFCGNGLEGWDEADDPSEQHAKYFPNCDYLKQQKGSYFVDEVHRKYLDDSIEHFQLKKGLAGLTPDKLRNILMLPAIKCLKLMKISEEDIKVAVDKYLKQKGDLRCTTKDLVHLLPENIRLMKAPRESPFADAPDSDDKDQLMGINRQRKDITTCMCCKENQISCCF